MIVKFLLAICTVFASWNAALAHELGPVKKFAGTCDASAAIFITDDIFIVASDENSLFRAYSLTSEKAVGKPVSIGGFLGLPDDSETEIEGAAPDGERSFWISSHGRTSKGKLDLDRQSFFALKASIENGQPKLELQGTVCRDLLKQLLKDNRLSSLDLEDLSINKHKDLAPKTEKGFNIEGLALSPNGDLLIGLRGRLRDAKAIVIPMINPDDVINGKKAKFDAPIFLDLGGLGIRSMEYNKKNKKYFIVAGSSIDKRKTFKLFEWSGRVDDKPIVRSEVDFETLSPEVIIFRDDKCLVLSDDGKFLMGDKTCGALEKDGMDVHFRGCELKLQ